MTRKKLKVARILPTEYQHFTHADKYGRWIEEELRRETWEETVWRYLNYMSARFPDVSPSFWTEAAEYILNLQVMPSMRCLMTAGPALDKDNAAGYNCAFLAMDSIRGFSEAMYILMCGCGLGFSVERQYTSILPKIPDELFQSNTCIKVHDSRVGWATALRELLSLLYSGAIPRWDTSSLRPNGARLKTFGGRASGPKPLEDLFNFTVATFKNARGGRLSSLDCHDILCKIGKAVVSGGVRRSAEISLSNLSDDRMRGAKTGDWRSVTPWRDVANNSAVFADPPSMDIFLKEWVSLFESKSGERGIYNIKAAQEQARRTGRRIWKIHFGTNPCAEIILRPDQFCNLTEVVARPADEFDNLADKIRIATILGTMQSTLTDFRFLNKQWKKNCEEERLLGVSITGICDHPILSGRMKNTDQLSTYLLELKQVAIDINEDWAEKLGINQSTSITCVKPSGTVSQLVNSANGIHPRYSDYFIRRVRLNKHNPIGRMLVAQDFPHEQSDTDEGEWVFSFAMKSPIGAVMRSDMTAIDQLELWLIYQDCWCEHKPSQTIYVREWEWLEVGAWVYKHFHRMSGVSFLPYAEEDIDYTQLVYEEIDMETYTMMKDKEPTIDWTQMKKFETEDNTTITHELACTADSCDL